MRRPAPSRIPGPRVRRSLALLAWCVVAAGCRPLVTPPPGCSGDAPPEACEPEPPAGTARVQIIDPLLPTDPAQAPTSGRYLAVTVKVESALAAREVELLCGVRRLATWSVAAEQESVQASALVDLLPCWDPVLGATVNPLPVQLTVAVLDQVGARHATEDVHLRVDFSQVEGLLGSDAGTVELTAPPLLTLTLPSRLAPGVEGQLRLDSNMALSEPPAVWVDGVPVAPVRQVDAHAWTVQVPADLPLGREAPNGELNQRSRQVPVTVLARGFGGQSTQLDGAFELARELRSFRLPAPLFNPPELPALAPVLTAEGLSLLLDRLENGTPSHLARLTPEGQLHQLELGGARNDPVDPLGFNAQGRLFLLPSGSADLHLQIAPLSGQQTSLSELLSPPITGLQPSRWAAAGSDLLCSEEPAPMGSCHLSPRVCVDGAGVVTRRSPVGNPAFASSNARPGGGPEVFVTYDHVGECAAPLPPILGIGAPGGDHHWLDLTALPLDAAGPYAYLQVAPAGAGAAVVVRNFDGSTLAAWRVDTDGKVARYPLEQGTLPGQQPVAAAPDGSLLLLGEGLDGQSTVSRWRPGQGGVPQVANLTDQYWSLFLPEASQAPAGLALPDGGTALLLAWDGGTAVLVLDVDLRERWRWTTPVPFSDVPDWQPALRLSPDGRQLWLIEPGDQRVTILGL